MKYITFNFLPPPKKTVHPNSLHSAHLGGGPDVFLLYDIYCLDVERPLTPTPECKELAAHFAVTHPSRAF